MIQTPMNLEKLSRWYDFTGQTIVITGGVGVLGSEIAMALARCGDQLAILDMRIEPGEALLERMGKHAENAAFFHVGVLRPESVRHAAAEVMARFGKVDCLINGAGGNQPQETTQPDQKSFDLPEAPARHPGRYGIESEACVHRTGRGVLMMAFLPKPPYHRLHIVHYSGGGQP